MNVITTQPADRRDRIQNARTVAIIALPRFTLLALGCIIDVLRLANRVAGQAVYRWQVIGLTRTVTSSSNVGVVADASIAEVRGTHADIVIVCGGLDGHLHNERKLRSWLRDLDQRGAIIGASSTGIWSLAKAGLLDGRRCAVHWDDMPSFSASFPLVDVQREIFVHDGRRLTCSGGVAIIDMVLHLIAVQHNAAFAGHVADLLIHARARAPDEKQRRSERTEAPAFGVVSRAIALMESNIETVLSIDDLADRLGRSPRQLERLFSKAHQMSPKKYYDLIRLKRARKLLAETDMSVTEVAIRCGYVSQTQFSSQFKKVFEKSPLRSRLDSRE